MPEFSLPDIEPGSRLGHYVISEKIAEGGMGAVYKALEMNLERYVAIKVLHDTFARDEAHRAQFLEEARAVAALRHRNIVPLYFVGEEKGLRYFAMAFIEGETIEDVLHKNGPLDGPTAYWFLAQAIAALEYASRSGIIHLDVKPSNFLVDQDNIVMLTDFGLAARHFKMRPDDEHELLGTPSYASPEHVLQNEADLRTDVYCLGATLFHLMTGRLPYESENVEDVCRSHVFEAFPLEKALKAGAPKGWVSLMMRMMEKKPEYRFQTYQELLAALDRVDYFRHGELNLGPPAERSIRRALPRTPAAPESMYGLLPPRLECVDRNGYAIKKNYTAAEVEEEVLRRPRPLAIHALGTHAQELSEAHEADFTDLMQSMQKMPLLRAAVDELTRFISAVSDDRADTDASKIELIGLQRTRNLALTILMLQSPWVPLRPLNWQPFWQYSVATGLLVEMILDMLELPATPLGYSAGLFHDVGRVALAELAPNTYIGTMLHAMRNDLSLMTVEREVFECDHAQVGEMWLRRHHVNKAVVQAVRHHEAPEEAGDASLGGVLRVKAATVETLALATHSASHLARQLGIGFNGDTYLQDGCWSELPSTKALWEMRRATAMSQDDFRGFFLESCRRFPEFGFTQTAGPAILQTDEEAEI